MLLYLFQVLTQASYSWNKFLSLGNWKNLLTLTKYHTTFSIDRLFLKYIITLI